MCTVDAFSIMRRHMASVAALRALVLASQIYLAHLHRRRPIQNPRRFIKFDKNWNEVAFQFCFWPGAQPTHNHGSAAVGRR